MFLDIKEIPKSKSSTFISIPIKLVEKFELLNFVTLDTPSYQKFHIIYTTKPVPDLLQSSHLLDNSDRYLHLLRVR